MTVSLAEATAAARRITDDFADPESAEPFEADALLLAGFVLAGDTERLRTAVARCQAHVVDYSEGRTIALVALGKIGQELLVLAEGSP